MDFSEGLHIVYFQIRLGKNYFKHNSYDILALTMSMQHDPAATPQQQHSLDDCAVRKVEAPTSKNRPFQFEVVLIGQTLKFAASSPEELSEWMEAFETAAEDCSGKDPKDPAVALRIYNKTGKGFANLPDHWQRLIICAEDARRRDEEAQLLARQRQQFEMQNAPAPAQRGSGRSDERGLQ